LQIEFLARFKTNQYYFYSEASTELKGYPLLMPEARFTQAQVREVVEYARERHIDVIPNVEWYGHLHDLFRLERYADLSVIPHGGEFNRQDPRIGPLLADWAGQLARLFPSPFFHIGFDETWLIKHEAAKLNLAPERLYLGQLKEVMAMLERLGKHPMAYADMLQKYPQIVPEVPRSLTVVPWHYEPLTDAEYDRKLSPFSKAGLTMVVQSAVRNWSWLAPDYEATFADVDALLAAGRRYRAVGLVQAGWTDDTQTLTRPARPAWAYASSSAWQSKPLNRSHFFSDYAAVLYPPITAPEVGAGLDALAQAESRLQLAWSGGTIDILWENPFAAERLNSSRGHKTDLRQARLEAEKAEEHLMSAIESGTDTGTLKSLLVDARMVDIAAMKLIYAVEIADFWSSLEATSNADDAWSTLGGEIGSKYHSRTSDMMDAMADIRERFREAWLTEFTPFRLGVATAKFDGEFQSWWKLQRRVMKAAGSPNTGLPPLESVIGGLW
jgi:hexosaminidase